MGYDPLLRDSNTPGVSVCARFDSLSSFRLGRRALVAGGAFLTVLVLSLLLFFLTGDRMITRVLFFPLGGVGTLVTEERYLPNHHNLEEDLRELVEGEIMGPVRHDATLLMPRDVTVRSLFVRNRILYLDLSAELVLAGPEYPLRGVDVFPALRRSISFNFPRVREAFITIDGQDPCFDGKEKIR
jgi:hypothetical protein